MTNQKVDEKKAEEKPRGAAKTKKSSRTRRSRPPPQAEPDSGSEGRSLTEAWAQAAPGIVRRGLAVGTLVAVACALLAGSLRVWIWILALEPIALGVVIGEASAAPSSARHRRPPRWSYKYVFAISFIAYVAVHVVFWLVSTGLPPSQSLIAFLQAVPSATAAPLFQSVDLARQLSLATGGAAELKYFLWLAEGTLMGLAATLAYRAGSVRMLRT